MSLGALFLIPGLILALSALLSRLTLEGDQLELRSALRTRTVHRDQIDGLQRIRNNYGKWTRIFLEEHRGVLTVSTAFTGSTDLDASYVRSRTSLLHMWRDTVPGKTR